MDYDEQQETNDLHGVRDRFVARHIKDLGEEASAEAKYSMYSVLVDEITFAALEYVKKSEHPITIGRFEYMLKKSIEVVDSVQYALTKDVWSSAEGVPTEEELKSYYNFWQHSKFPVNLLKKKDIPYIDKESLQEAVAEYVDLPYRLASLDRLLVDTLVAHELYAYGDQMLNELKIPFLPVMSPLKQPHPLIAAMKGQFWNGVILFGLAALSLFAGEKEWIGSHWGVGIALVLATIFAFYFVVALMLLPSFWKKHNAAKTKTLELLESMVGLYAQLDPSGLISSKHITHNAELAAEKGVIWLSLLFVLLDDISNRTGRF